MIQQGAILSVFDPVLGQTFIFGARGKVFSDEQIIRQNKRIPDGVAILRKQLRVESLKAIELQKRMKAFVNRKQCEIQGEVNLSFFWSVFLLY